MKDQKIVRVNDKGYLINAFKGTEGWRYLSRLTKYVFPFLQYFFKEEAEESEMIATLQELLSGDNATEVEKLIVDLVSSVELDNQRINFDTEFRQNYDALFILVLEIVKLNYLDSFQRLVTNLPKVSETEVK